MGADDPVERGLRELTELRRRCVEIAARVEADVRAGGGGAVGEAVVAALRELAERRYSFRDMAESILREIVARGERGRCDAMLRALVEEDVHCGL